MVEGSGVHSEEDGGFRCMGETSQKKVKILTSEGDEVERLYWKQFVDYIISRWFMGHPWYHSLLRTVSPRLCALKKNNPTQRRASKC